MDSVTIVQSGTLAVQIAFTGLVAWFGGRWLEREKARLNKGIHAHKIQFENEYRLYSDLWDKLISLRAASTNLRLAEIDYAPKKSEEQRREEFIDAFNAFNQAVERNRPFYAVSVYEAMKALRMIVRTEWRQANPDRPITNDIWKEVEVNREEIVKAVESTCGAIRERLQGMIIE